MAAITICSDLGAQENKICHCFHFSPFYLSWSHGIRCHDLGFLNVGVKPAFPLSSFTFIKRFFSSSSLSASKSGLSLGMQPVLFITWKIRGGNHCNLYFLFLFLFYFLTLQYCIGFATYQHESATGIHVFPILNPPPSSWTLLPPPSPDHPSGLSQCTSPKHPVSCTKPGLATRFIYDIIHHLLLIDF